MSKSNAHETEYLEWAFQSQAAAWEANTDFFLSLHTSNPADGGAQNTSEVAYTGYARVAMDRQAAGDFDVTGNLAENNVLVQFPICDPGHVGSVTATHWGIGTLVSGAGQLIHWAELDNPLSISANIRPQFDPGDIRITED